jgi:hypothetical protein
MSAQVYADHQPQAEYMSILDYVWTSVVAASAMGGSDHQ